MATDKDVVVIGAGFSGLYAVHKFRDELGLAVQGFEAADGVGGTWWWNRYPGARCDIESVHYSYSFSDEIQREWHWSERYARQDEILKYLEWVADRLDLRRSFRLGTRVTSLSWNEAAAHWVVGTDDGATCTARFVLSGVGGLSHPKTPEFPGIDRFDGELYWTSSWPDRLVDLRGKRVGIVGTGASGIQVIQEIADQVGHLTVFQRTPNYVTPLQNRPYSPEESRRLAADWRAVRGGDRICAAGAPYVPIAPSALSVSAEERRRIYDEAWESGGMHLGLSTFADLMWNAESNETLAEYVRERIRERVKDPATADLLCPSDHPYATKRPPYETNYYEAFNLAHVDLVDVRKSPIVEVTATGLRTSTDTYEFDVLVLATGFDVFTGASLAIPTTGRDGLTLQEKWSNGPRNYLGVQISGFPNLFNVIGPLNIAAVYNTPQLIEEQINFAAKAVGAVLERGAGTIDATPESEQRWVDLANGVFPLSLWSKAEQSWFHGANIQGKPVGAYILPIGGPLYMSMLRQAAGSGWAGFAIDGEQVPPPPLVRLDPAATVALAGMMSSSMKPLEQCTIDELRALNEAAVNMQLPGPDLRVADLADPPVRVYNLADAGDQRPVVVFGHGGGFVAGSVDSVDPMCRTLAARLGAVVVSVDYRLAPEHPHPAAVEDMLAAVIWTREHIAEYGGDPARIAIMGESAGANLAAVTALRARDLDVPLAAQVLIYPPIDPESDTVSMREFSQGPFLTAAAVRKFWGCYLDDRHVTSAVSPAQASLAGVAPALVITVEVDPTRDEAERYAQLLREAGVDVRVGRVEGLFHGTFGMTALIPNAQQMYDLVQEYLAPRLEATVGVI
ncbi:flavin-containing monooxygenase [Nocardia fluminea]|uniref:flavin-containing monooxygenase n=1 Tax=Nocardia fluminea TaxID=134984 RepID=UPI0033EEE67A